MGKRIFISKNASEVDRLNNYLVSQGKILIAHSFLQFSPLEFKIKEKYDIVFFGSPRSVSFFTSQIEIPEFAQIACVGGITSEAISSINRKVDFSGENIGSIHKVAETFKVWSGDRKVLFPISSLSLKTISSQFDPDKKIEIEVYQTDIIGRAIETCDTYVFTSPSNVKGFLELNSIPDGAQVIAWGETTKSALKSANIIAHDILSNPSIDELKPLL